MSGPINIFLSESEFVIFFVLSTVTNEEVVALPGLNGSAYVE